MSLNNKEVMEALLAGKVLRDTTHYQYRFRLNAQTGRIESSNSVIGNIFNPIDDTNLTFLDWEIEPEYLEINGYKVPKPLISVEGLTEVYIVSLLNKDFYTTRPTHPAYYDDLTRWIAYGLVHTTKEAAELHAKALLSFTKEPQ